LIRYEEVKKTILKKSLNEKLLKYGKPCTYRNEMRFAEGWEEGEGIIKAKRRLVTSLSHLIAKYKTGERESRQTS
jgi:hypothetical protein